MSIKSKLNFWLRGVYLTSSLTPYSKTKHSNKYVYYLPHQRISSSIPFCIISNKNILQSGYTEELIRCTLVPVKTCYGQRGVRMYLHFTGLKPKNTVKTVAIISWIYEKCMTNTYKSSGKLFTPEKNDLVIFQGTNGGRFHYVYSVFITRNNINFEKPDYSNTFIYHKGILAIASQTGISSETYGIYPTPAEKLIQKN